MDNISGVQKLNAALANLTRDLRQALPGIVESSAALVEDEIKARVSVDSGTLLEHIGTVVTEKKNRTIATVHVADSEQGGQAHHAIFNEFGTSSMAADPFFRPGIEAAKPQVQAKLIQGITQVLANHAG